MNTEEKISVAGLASGEQAALKILEISSVPDASILPDGGDEGIEARYQREMASLLAEIYQDYRLSGAGEYSRDISLELLWVTRRVENQPYQASIHLFLLVRAIDSLGERACVTVQELSRVCRTMLENQRYECREASYEELTQRMDQVQEQTVRALVKEERLENLQNRMLPYCYEFDILQGSGEDLSRLVHALMEAPGCMVSFQLIPTYYQGDELATLSSMSQSLDTLYSGDAFEGAGSVMLAEKPAELYKYYVNNQNRALFQYNILVYGDMGSVNHISTRLYGQLNSSASGGTGMRFVDLAPEEAGRTGNFYPQPWALGEILLNRNRDSYIWNSGIQNMGNFYRLAYVITAEEASEFFRLPVGSNKIAAGLEIHSSERGSKTFAEHLINAGDLDIGVLKSSPRGDRIGISLKDLTKHMLVVGTPGSGKTTFSVSLLDRLWKEHGIPFLVIEPAKNEYRALVQSIPELQVFTPGKNFISPFVFNPFVPPKNVKLETYKSTLKTAFAAAVSMSTPLDKIFEESIHNCYSDFRWLDTYTSDNMGRIFNISDFIRCFQQTFDEIGYTGDARNIGRAGVVRLNSLVHLFDNYHSIPIEDLLQKPTVIELAAIENSDQKALIISLLLLSILAYVNSNYVGEGELKNVILLEEAHVLLDAESNGGQGEANPSAIAQGLVKRMLAELRSYGVGMVIADQSPRKVTADVVALTDIKLAFRLVEASDKQILADSTNMSEVHTARLSRLRPGEAFLFFNKLEDPEEVVTPDYRMEHAISISLSDEGIRRLSTYWNDKREKLRPYPECEKTPYCQESCDWERRILAREIARRIFVRHFRSNSTDFEQVKQVFKRISALVQAELNDEPFTPELLSCVKLQLWRRIRYGTRIPVPPKILQASLERA